jgi:signal peptidase I
MTDDTQRKPQDDGSIKETLVSLIISFVMALVFRSYVVEAFIIPTGSMAPTLLGAHIRFQSEQTGNSWTVNPWYFAADMETPLSIQSQGRDGAPSATDPMTTSKVNPIRIGGRAPQMPQHGYIPPAAPVPVRAGDRILVQKYLYELFPPKRFDVVVFKNPELSTQNFIKRLIGLPNEQVWVADGDVFTRPIEKTSDGAVTPKGDWSIARKPARVQDEVWRPIYSSEFAPLNPERDGRRWFITPWKGLNWETENRREYRCDSAEATSLAWNSSDWPITDWVPYNEWPGKFAAPSQLFPVADLRMSAGIKPDAGGMTATATIAALGHEFQAVILTGSATIRVRPIMPAAAQQPAWTDLATAVFGGLEPGRVTNVEFCHVDQSLELHVDGEVLLRGEYNWGPSERLLHATGKAGRDYTDISHSGNDLPLAAAYGGTRPSVQWDFNGSPATLYRVGLARDLYYEAAKFQRGGWGPALATHPMNLASLGEDQFFVMGDNSPSSKDGRLWEEVDPWVSDQIDGTIGIVPRKLLLGKAFFVYFPAPYRAFGSVPVPDFGRLRFIH